MKILLNNNDLNEALNKVSNLGFVPTMGSLHEGHISLIRKSKKKASKTIVSIFINTKQFNNKKDFKRYPKNHKKDLSILKNLNVNYLYLPKTNQIYDSKRVKKIQIKKKDKILCAKYRKGHFEGVLDVMDRLIKKIRPKFIFMGIKDYQQLHLVKNFVEKRHRCKIVPCKTIRNSNQLALSSRNLLLSKKGKFKAEKLIKNLIKFKKNLKNINKIKKILNQKKIELNKKFKINVEYLELRDIFTFRESIKVSNSRIFISYYLNNIRLIDNF